ncbi:hypothetical protein MW887_006125 [Aspergillus wentii]|nr:hypothetical protein MW887_006125 [Aspergillus wentii]
MPKEVLGSCLKSLESRPQWWTSYSNSRQNAVVICQAARVENEKEELLGLHRSIVESTIKLNDGFQEALRMAADESSQHRAFMHANEVMRARLVHDLEETESRFKYFVANLFHDIESSFDSVMTIMTSVLGRVQTEVTVLGKDIKNASNEVERLQQALEVAHAEALARNEQLTDIHQRDALAHHHLASSIQSSLGSLLQGDISRISQNMKIFDSSLEWLSGKMDLIVQQESRIQERLRTFEASLEESEVKAEGLLQTQKLQTEAIATQSQAQESLQTNMRISQALLDKTAATAANLQTMIDETTVKYKEYPALGGFLGTYSAWTVCALLFSIIGAQNPRSALAVFFVGSIHMVATKIFY